MVHWKSALASALGASLLAAPAFAQQAYISPLETYSLSITPQTFRTETQTVVVEEAREELMVVPPQFRTVQQSLVLVDAHCPGERLVTRAETVEVEPAYVRVQLVPPVYRTITKQVPRTPGASEWIAEPDGSFRLQVTQPSFRTITTREEASPKSSRRISIPARTVQYQVRRLAGPPQRCLNRIPAVVKQIERQVVDVPASVRRVAVPGKTQTLTKRVPTIQTITLSPQPAPPPAPNIEVQPAPSITASVTQLMPMSADPELRYRAQVDNENCVLWKSFTDGDAAVEPGRFPWPPPNPSFQSTLGAALYAGVETLGDMNDRLSAALDRIGIPDFRRKYYPVPNGFALVTSLEKIDDEGRPTEDRWSQDIFALDPPSISNWLWALFNARSGRFRVIALVVTSDDVDTDGSIADRDEATGWLNSGLSALNSDRADCAFGSKHRVTVLVYEFEHVEQSEPQMVSLTNIDHLSSSGLRTELGRSGTER